MGPKNDREVFQDDIEAEMVIATMSLGRAVVLQPGKALWIKVKETGRFLGTCFQALTWPFTLALLSACLAAALGGISVGGRRLMKLVGCVAAAYALIIVAFFTHIRFVLPVITLLSLLAGIGICWTR